jgi:hypothetical protein
MSVSLKDFFKLSVYLASSASPLSKEDIFDFFLLDDVIASGKVLDGECIDVVVRGFCCEEEETEEMCCRDEGLDDDKPEEA